MTDKTNSAAEPTELDDKQMENAVGGRMPAPARPTTKPNQSTDPCDGGE